MSKTSSWDAIDAIAAEIGVDENNRRVWRQRHVPHKWRIPILEEARKRRVKISISDFERRYANTRGAA